MANPQVLQTGNRMFLINPYKYGGGGGAWSPAVNGKTPVAAWVPSRDTAGNGTTTLTDLVGSNDGTLTNMDAGTDWVADTDAGGVRALDFDGVNDVVLTTINGPAGNSARSVSVWIKNLGSIGGPLVGWGDNVLGQRFEVATGAGTFGQPTGGIVLAVGGAFVGVDTNVTDNNWHHVCLTFPAAGVLSAVKIYIDGTLRTITHQLNQGDAVNTGVGPVRLGRNLQQSAHYAGAEDDIRIFDQALDATDITYLYASGSGRGVDAS
jgi:hypothetical protein